jgi:Flp pilus assembly protein TadD
MAKSLVEQNRLKDAVELCLRAAPNRSAAEVAIVLTSLLPTNGDDPNLEHQIQPVITSALGAEGNNVELLMSLAVRRAAENDNDEAIKLFRKILELKPNDSLALNNLATLLAERPNQLGDARRYVEQAIAIVGRDPALLDTLGTILTRSGKNEEGATALEEAVAGTAADPRYYFHLAVSYQHLGRDGQAKEALQSARKLGLDKAILTKVDRDQLASLNDQLLSSASHN